LRSNDRDETKALAVLRKVAQESQSQTNAPRYELFLQLPEIDQLSLLHSITVIDSSPHILEVEDQLSQILRPAAPRGKTNLLLERLEGWWFSLVIQSLTEGPSSIPFTVIENKIDEIRESLSRSSLPVDFAEAIPPPEIIDSYDNRPFVQQLRLIKIGPRRLEFAVRDYYRAFEQRSLWARQELLVDNEIEKYDQQLIEVWEPRFEEMRERLEGNADLRERERSGGEIYRWVEIMEALPLRALRARFLCHGSFHMLANRCAVGWHPDYADFIREHHPAGAE
jgi:hypothetical protein